MNFLAGKPEHYAILKYLEDMPRTKPEIMAEFSYFYAKKINVQTSFNSMLRLKMVQKAGENSAGKQLWNGTSEAFDNLDALEGLIKQG